MESQLVLLLIATMLSGAISVQFTFENKCTYTVWPGVLTNPGKPGFPTTGFQLASRSSQTFQSPADWAGRFWGRTGCTTTNGRLICATADCASGQIACNGAGAIPPATLAEFTLRGSGNQDYYDISLVDGFNLPMSITPQGSGSGCRSTSCPANVNAICPPELSVRGGDGRTIACKSACLAFNQPQYCCTGNYAGGPDKCPATNYSRVFKNACPQAYSYAYDDQTSTFTCAAGADYRITYCP